MYFIFMYIHVYTYIYIYIYIFILFILFYFFQCIPNMFEYVIEYKRGFIQKQALENTLHSKLKVKQVEL
jgi:hypothetical protein